MTVPDDGATPCELIDATIAELDDWRGEMLARVRALIHRAEPDVHEGDAVDEDAFEALIVAAVAHNASRA